MEQDSQGHTGTRRADIPKGDSLLPPRATARAYGQTQGTHPERGFPGPSLSTATKAAAGAMVQQGAMCSSTPAEASMAAGSGQAACAAMGAAGEATTPKKQAATKKNQTSSKKTRKTA